MNRQEVPGLSTQEAHGGLGSVWSPGPLLPAGLGYGKATDGKSYTSILYGNGPGYALGGASRPDVNDSESSECRGGCVGGGTPAGNSREGEPDPRPP